MFDHQNSGGFGAQADAEIGAQETQRLERIVSLDDGHDNSSQNSGASGGDLQVTKQSSSGNNIGMSIGDSLNPPMANE